jgi:hypothetical protein
MGYAKYENVHQSTFGEDVRFDAALVDGKGEEIGPQVKAAVGALLDAAPFEGASEVTVEIEDDKISISLVKGDVEREGYATHSQDGDGVTDE